MILTETLTARLIASCGFVEVTGSTLCFNESPSDFVRNVFMALVLLPSGGIQAMEESYVYLSDDVVFDENVAGSNGGEAI